VEPKAGDRIGETVDGVRLTFEVVGDAGPGVKASGQRAARYRVNVVRVTDEAGN
jgi:hypothetical protein